MPLSQLNVGPVSSGDSTNPTARAGRLSETMISHTRSRFAEQASRGNIFSMTLTATTTGVAAGNIVAAAAAASTNFALFNPSNSGANYHLIKVGIGVISGTPGAGPMFHGIISTGIPTVATTGSIVNHYTGKAGGSSALGWATAAGTTLTGGGAPVTQRLANFTSTATAAASVGELNAIEIVDGDIVIAPGNGWVPMWGAAGTSLLNGYSVTWEEVPV